MSLFDRSGVVYVGAVLGVIAVASLAVFNLRGMAAKAHRHWDADIDRIIARQQEKRQDLLLAALARADIPDMTNGSGREIAAISRNEAIAAPETTPDEIAVFSKPAATGPKAEVQDGQKTTQRSERRRQHFIPRAFATLPKFAATATATSTTLLRLR